LFSPSGHHCTSAYHYSVVALLELFYVLCTSFSCTQLVLPAAIWAGPLLPPRRRRHRGQEKISACEQQRSLFPSHPSPIAPLLYVLSRSLTMHRSNYVLAANVGDSDDATSLSSLLVHVFACLRQCISRFHIGDVLLAILHRGFEVHKSITQTALPLTLVLSEATLAKALNALSRRVVRRNWGDGTSVCSTKMPFRADCRTSLGQTRFTHSNLKARRTAKREDRGRVRIRTVGSICGA